MSWSKGKGQDEGKGKGKAREALGKGSDGFWTLWVGNLPQGYDQEILDALFKDVGGGKSKKNFLGGSCGTSSSDQWAKIFFDSRAEAEFAMNMYDGVQIQWPPGHDQVHKLTVKWFDFAKAEDNKFEAMPFDVKMDVTRKYYCYGVTGKRYHEDKGWIWDHPRIPDYIKDLVFHGWNEEQFKELYQEQEAQGQGKGKDKGKGKGNDNDLQERARQEALQRFRSER